MNTEPWLAAKIATLRGRLAVDVGANVGHFAEEIAPRFAAVLAFEPHPEAFALLARDAPANVLPINAALDGAAGRLTIEEFAANFRPGDQSSAGGRAASLGTRIGAAVGSFEARAIPLDALQLDAVDAIKIDVEGFEANVVAGSLATIDRCRPAIICEIHAAALGDSIAELLGQRGYAIERIDHPIYVRRRSAAAVDHYWLYARANR